MRSLVFGAGGMRIGYHVGVFHALMQRGDTFDAFIGSSAGALCAAILAQYKTSELNKALAHLGTILQLNTSDIWKPWALGMVSGAWKPSLVDSSPLRSLIVNNVSKARLRDSGKSLVVCAVDTVTGQMRTFTERDPDVLEGLMASCAVPGVFEPVQVGSRQMWDSAVREVAPVRHAVKIGSSAVTVVLLTPKVRRFGEPPKTVLEAVNRAFDIQAAEITENDIEVTDLYSRMAALRATDRRMVHVRVIRPRWELSTTLLELNPGDSRTFYQMGFQDGKTAAL